MIFISENPQQSQRRQILETAEVENEFFCIRKAFVFEYGTRARMLRRNSLEPNHDKGRRLLIAPQYTRPAVYIQMFQDDSQRTKKTKKSSGRAELMRIEFSLRGAG
jgi:hypothetical protein